MSIENATLEQRLAILEIAVADLQRQLANGVPRVNWLEQVAGSIQDEEAFAEVLAFGRRELRASDAPEEAAEDLP